MIAWQEARPAALGVLLLALAGCAHEVQVLGKSAPALESRAPLPLTLAVAIGSFDRSRIDARGITDLFARELRAAHLFEGVMYPIPAGASPRWELELSGSDAVSEPDSNFWKAGLAGFFAPLAFLLWLENDYELQLEALLIERRELVHTFRASARIRHRYQRFANRQKMEAEGIEQVVSRAAREMLTAIQREAPTLERLNARLR